MNVLIVTGMPRSGTSWLGQIINSNPSVLFRTEPLFSYKFKNLLNEYSSCKEINLFLHNLINVNDDFILQKDKLITGHYPQFTKRKNRILAFKTTRHHELLKKYLNCIPELHIVAIVRHPCGVINSWLNSHKEFTKKNCLTDIDWRSGACRKGQVGEYWGFNDWIKVTKMFDELERKHKNFHIVKYSDLVQSTHDTTLSLFTSIDLNFTSQTSDFIKECHSRDDKDPYSVYKSKDVMNKWKHSLSKDIVKQIIFDTHSARLDKYL